MRTGCPGCRVDFMLSKEGPGMVYLEDIQFTDPGVKPAEKIPLVILGEGEKLVMEGYATKRKQRAHQVAGRELCAATRICPASL